MRLSFDRDADTLAIVFADSTVARTIEAGDGRLLDLDEAGQLVALEVLGASAGFSLFDLAEEYGFRDQLADAEQEIFRFAFSHTPEFA